MDLRDLARTNRRQILRCILQNGGMSRTEIARTTGLANSSVTEIVQDLIARNFLRTQEIRRNGRRGRPAIVLSVDPEGSLVVVADYDESGARAHLVSPSCEILRTETVSLPPQHSMETYLAAETEAVARVGAGCWNKVQAITVVGPGLVDPKKGLLLKSTLFGWMEGPYLQSFLKFGRQTFLQNGSRLQAVAENWYGAAADVDDFLYFNLDRGIGGAIFLDGLLVEGPSHGAGEFGHVIIDPSGRPCSCGAAGCLETIASMPAIVSALHSQGCSSFPEAWNLYQQGHPAAVEVFDRVAVLLARTILDAAIMIGPTTVLVGGEMVRATGGAILGLIGDRLGQYRSLIPRLDLRASHLPAAHSMVTGAVLYALQELDLQD